MQGLCPALSTARHQSTKHIPGSLKHHPLLLLRSHPSETPAHNRVSRTERKKWGCLFTAGKSPVPEEFEDTSGTVSVAQGELRALPQNQTLSSDSESATPSTQHSQHCFLTRPPAARKESKHRKLPQMAPAIGRTHKRYWTENTKHKQNDLFGQKYKHRWINLSQAKLNLQCNSNPCLFKWYFHSLWKELIFFACLLIYLFFFKASIF